MSKRTKNVSRPKAIAEFVIKRHEHVMAMPEEKRSAYLTSMCARLVRDELRRLGWYTDKRTGKLEGKPICSATTLASVFSEYRQIVLSTGVKHHLIEKQLNKLIEEFSDIYPALKDEFSPDLPLETLHENLIKLKGAKSEHNPNERLVDPKSEFGQAVYGLKIHFALYYNLDTPTIVKDTKKTMGEESLNEKHELKVFINPSWVKNYIHDIFEQKKPKITDLSLALALATGRRLTEIIRTGQFKKIDDVTLLFSGQLKTKNRKLFEELKPYPIFTLVDSALVLKAFKKLRSMLKAETVSYVDRSGQDVTSSIFDSDVYNVPLNNAIKQKYASVMNQTAKKVLGMEMTFKSSRAIWAALTYDEFASDMSQDKYRAEALGHTGGDLSTQQHYYGFEVDDSVETIKIVETRNDDGEEKTQTEFDAALLEHLKKVDRSVWNSRAKAWPVISDWMIDLLEQGVSLIELEQDYLDKLDTQYRKTLSVKFASYVRGNLFINGKKLGAPSANGWAQQGVDIDEWYKTFTEK